MERPFVVANVRKWPKNKKVQWSVFMISLIKIWIADSDGLLESIEHLCGKKYLAFWKKNSVNIFFPLEYCKIHVSFLKKLCIQSFSWREDWRGV